MSLDEETPEAEPDLQPRKPKQFLDNFGLQVITSAVNILGNRLDKIGALVAMIEKDREHAHTSSLRSLQKRLDVQERVAIESWVRALSASRPALLDKLIEESLKKHERETTPEESREGQTYPLAFEQLMTVVSDFVDEIEEQIWKEINDRYSDNEIKKSYASQYLINISQPDLAEQLSESLFPTVVQKFENFMGGLARSALNKRGAKSLGDLPPVPFEVIEKYVRPNDLRRWAIDRRIEDFIRGGYQEWHDTALRWVEFDIESVFGDWNVMREAMARTRLFSRGTGGRVDAEYMEETKFVQLPDVEMWQQLRTTPEYLRHLVEAAESLSLGIALRWAAYFFPKHDSNVELFVDKLVNLESREKWAAALALSEELLASYVHPEHPSYKVAMINLWLCRQQLGTEDANMRHAIAQFTPDDALERIGIEAIRRDWPALLAAIDDACNQRRKDGYLEAEWLGQMPLVRRAMREHPPVKQLLEKRRQPRKRGGNGRRR